MEKSPLPSSKADGWILYPPASQQEAAFPHAVYNDTATLAKIDSSTADAVLFNANAASKKSAKSTRARRPRTPPTYATIIKYTPRRGNITPSRLRELLKWHQIPETVPECDPLVTNEPAVLDVDTAMSDSELSTGTEIRTVTGTEWALQFSSPSVDSSDDEEISTPRPQLFSRRMCLTRALHMVGSARHLLNFSDGCADRERYTIRNGSTLVTPRFKGTTSSESGRHDFEIRTSMSQEQHAQMPSTQSRYRSGVMQGVSSTISEGANPVGRGHGGSKINVRLPPRSEAAEALTPQAGQTTSPLRKTRDHEGHSPNSKAVRHSGWLSLLCFVAGFLLCIGITNWKLAGFRKELVQAKRPDSRNRFPDLSGQELAYQHNVMASEDSLKASTGGNDWSEESLRDRIDRYLGWAWLANYD